MKILEIIGIKYILIYFALINLLAFIMFWVDKRAAQNGQWRISEKALIIVSMLGGSVGSLISMKTFRHKTKKMKFVLGIPIILILQIAFIIYMCYNGYVI